MNIKLCWSADFETTTDDKDCRVWAWALSNVDKPDNFKYGNCLEGFLDFCANPKHNYTMYFFNLKFDASFILSHILKAGYREVDSSKDKKSKTFTTLITDRGVYYSIEIYFEVKGKHVNKVRILDAMKLFPGFSVERLASGFGLEIGKLELDYRKKREIGHILTEHEIEYIRNDVTIVAQALNQAFNKKLNKMTIASNAIRDFRSRCVNFKELFPELSPDIDASIRASYKGGFTYLSDKYVGIEQGKGMTLDVNSLYPSVMKFNKMPVGQPKYFEGQYEFDPCYDLYIQSLECKFDLKPGKIPSIQIKHSLDFIANEYLKSSDGEYVELTLTSVDLKLFFDQYNVDVKQYLGGFKFQSSANVFDKYIDYWTEEKISAGKEGRKGSRQLAKLMLNSLY